MIYYIPRLVSTPVLMSRC